jgi:hypothetical protein
VAIGVIVGAAAMYLALRPPWSDDGERVAVAELDAAVGSGGPSTKGKKGRKARRGRGGGGGPMATGGDDGWEGAGEGGDDGGEIAPAPAIVLTDADRRMEWRGDDLGMPPKRIDMTDGSEARSLDDGEIKSAIASGGDSAIDCMVRGAAGTDLSATVTLKMVVGGNGKVGKLKVHAPRYLFEHGLLACARKAAGRFPFPATGAATLVTAPFELNR